MSDIDYPWVEADDDVVDNYHGTRISDPYRWLEDIHSKSVKDFVQEQNELSKEFIEKCKTRPKIRERLCDLWTYDNYECPFRRGHRYFYFNDGLLFMMDCLDQDEPPRAVLNVNYEGVPGENINLSPCLQDKTGECPGDRMCSISYDGSCIAFGVTENGSIWNVIHFKDICNNGTLYPDMLENVLDTFLSWTLDNKGIFYGKYPDKNTFKQHKLYYHIVGTDQSEDKVICEFPDHPNWELIPKVSDCGSYVIIYVLKDCSGRSHVYLRKVKNLFTQITEKKLSDDLLKAQSHLIPLVTDFEGNYDYITNQGKHFYFLTNKDAPNSKVVRVNVTKTFPNLRWKSVVKEDDEDVLDWAICVNKKFLVTCYISDVRNTLKLRALSNGSILQEFPLNVGSIIGHTGTSMDQKFFFKFTSFLTPGIIFQVDFSEMDEKKKNSCWDGKCGAACSEKYVPATCQARPELILKIFRESTLDTFNPHEFEINQVFYSSKDKTRISMFLICKKNLSLTGNNPCLLRGYGGFNASLKPRYDPTNIIFIRNFDGIIAIANIRGGGEYGTNWYEDGIRFKKQNSFDDFIAAAEFLIKRKYTCPAKLAIKGESNGGLVVAVCVNQRPSLFGAATSAFGVMDMLRFHKFSPGMCWTSDYGCPTEKRDFENLLKFSPLHNVKLPLDRNVQYPAMLLITAENDERVLPLHSYKMIAQLQAEIGSASKQTNPLLLRVETSTGHGEGMSFDAAMDEVTDTIAFLMLTLNLTFKN